jgi:hypothetical protein
MYNKRMANDIQFNDPADVSRAMWNARKSEQQDYLSKLSGGSWSQPPWQGWNYNGGAYPSNHAVDVGCGSGLSGGIVAGDEVFQRRFPRFPMKTGGSWFPMSQRALPEYDLFGSGSHNNFFQRFAQDGDMGFFYGMKGGAEPLGMNPFPPNSMPEDDVVRPLDKPIASESKVEPDYVEPSAVPDTENLVLMTKSEVAEPEQHALHVPPYSATVRTGFGKDSALYEEPFEFPEYKGSLHKKKNRFSK